MGNDAVMDRIEAFTRDAEVAMIRELLGMPDGTKFKSLGDGVYAVEVGDDKVATDDNCNTCSTAPQPKKLYCPSWSMLRGKDIELSEDDLADMLWDLCYDWAKSDPPELVHHTMRDHAMMLFNHLDEDDAPQSHRTKFAVATYRRFNKPIRAWRMRESIRHKLLVHEGKMQDPNCEGA